MTDRTQELVTRLEKLEKQNRNLKRWGIGGLAALGMVGLMSASAVVCKTVWAERFVLKDPNMRERAVITAYETGGAPKFSLLDQHGKPALTLGVDKAGKAYVEVKGEEGLVRRPFRLSAEGQATVAPEDKEGLIH
jgi:hypothetical protein